MRSGRGAGQFRARSGRRVLGWVLASILLVCAGGAIWWLIDAPGPRTRPTDTAGRGGSSTPGEDFSIWFASPQEDALIAEIRRLQSGPTPIDRAQASLQELIAGPKRDAIRTLSAEVTVRQLFIDNEGTAYIDFSDALSRTHPGGAWAEMLTLRSIMQTVVANVPEIKRVQILIEGRAVETLAGHVDIRRPLDATWVVQQR